MTTEKQEPKQKGRIIEVPLTMAEIIEMDMWLFRLREMRKKGQINEDNTKDEVKEEDSKT